MLFHISRSVRFSARSKCTVKHRYRADFECIYMHVSAQECVSKCTIKHRYRADFECIYIHVSAQECVSKCTIKHRQRADFECIYIHVSAQECVILTHFGCGPHNV